MHTVKTFCAALLLLLFAGSTYGQAPLEPSQLPSRTIFYVIWRGTPPGEVRAANPLLSLWDDPGFAPTRGAILDSFLNDANSSKPGAKTPAAPANPLTRQDLDDYASLLENPLEFGYLSEPKRTAGASVGLTSAHHWNGLFFIYNRSGKEALLSKALLRLHNNEENSKNPSKLSQVTIAGVSALKVEQKASVTYWIEDGKYAVSAGEPAVLEEILPRLQGKAPASPTLAQSAAYQEAQPILGNGPIEFFLRIPDLRDIPLDNAPTAPNVRWSAILDALKLETIHSICGHVTFENARSHLQGAAFGDTSAGSLFDMISEGTAAPASASLVSADTVYYNSSQINFLGIYNTVRRIAGAFFPKGQEGNVAVFESLAQTRIGRPIPEALALFTGEFASIQNSPALDQKKQVYFVGIRNKPETLKLLRNVLAENISSERNEGDTTFLKVSLGGKNSAAGTMQYNFYNVAVTSDAILAGNRPDAIRELLAKRSSAPAWPSAAQTARAQFPQSLVGFNYVDFQRLDWAAMKENWRKEVTKTSAQAAVSTGQRAPASLQLPSWLDQLDPQVLSRHLHFAASASWKDATGIHFEQWLD